MKPVYTMTWWAKCFEGVVWRVWNIHARNRSKLACHAGTRSCMVWIFMAKNNTSMLQSSCLVHILSLRVAPHHALITHFNRGFQLFTFCELHSYQNHVHTWSRVTTIWLSPLTYPFLKSFLDKSTEQNQSTDGTQNPSTQFLINGYRDIS